MMLAINTNAADHNCNATLRIHTNTNVYISCRKQAILTTIIGQSATGTILPYYATMIVLGIAVHIGNVGNCCYCIKMVVKLYMVFPQQQQAYMFACTSHYSKIYASRGEWAMGATPQVLEIMLLFAWLQIWPNFPFGSWGKK